MSRRSIAALLVIASASGANAQQSISARIDSVMAPFNQPNAPGVQIAVLKDGVVVLERGYGLAQLEYGVKITPATVFHVASVSKQFTAFANVLLAQQGKLLLDDDIRKHLPELKELPKKVTIRQLIHHTSGVRDQWELAQMAGWRMDDVITRDQIMTLMKRQRELNFEPGSQHLYSNMGYTLLAEIVERVSGQTFNDFLTTNVFRPLGMHSTHVHNDHSMIVPNRAYSYSPGANNTWRNAVLSYANQGATSLFTTAGDLARWLNNFETAQVGGPAVIRQMRERGVLNNGDTLSYAFAITRSMHRGREVWGHTGGDAGFRTIVMHIPSERLGVVVLSNAGNANPARVALAITDAYLGETTPVTQTPPPQQPPQTQPAAPSWKASFEDLKAYDGEYYSPELNVSYRIEARGDTLFLQQNRLGEGRLLPVERDVFRANRTYRFERSATGAVTGFRVTGGRVRNLHFVRRPG